MDKDFDFNSVEKRVPYRVPDGFFDSLEENVWKEVGGELSATVKRKRSRRLMIIRSLTAAVAAVALTLTIITLTSKQDGTGYTEVEQAFSQLSQADQTYLLEAYQEDIFINEQ